MQESGELWSFWDNINPNQSHNTGSSSFFRDYGDNHNIYNVSGGPSFRCGSDMTRPSSRFNYNVNHMNNPSSSSSMVSGGESSGSRRVSQRFNILSSLGEWSSRRSHFYTLDNARMESSHYLNYCINHDNDDEGHHIIIQEPNDMWRCGDQCRRIQASMLRTKTCRRRLATTIR